MHVIFPSRQCAVCRGSPRWCAGCLFIVQVSFSFAVAVLDKFVCWFVEHEEGSHIGARIAATMWISRPRRLFAVGAGTWNTSRSNKTNTIMEASRWICTRNQDTSKQRHECQQRICSVMVRTTLWNFGGASRMRRRCLWEGWVHQPRAHEWEQVTPVKN